MSARHLCMAGRLAAPLLAATALGAIAPVLAQEPVRQRTGPDASAPQTPDFAIPVALPLPAFATPTTPTSSSAPLTIRDVAIRTETGPDGAPALTWRPLTEKLSGLTLTHSPGEPLDAGWVRRQFEGNGLIGGVGTADRALALVQLINASFLSAGYLNSGLVVQRDAPLVDGTLNLDLIYGRLATLESGGPAMTVKFAGDSPGGLSAAYISNRMPSALRRPLNGLDVERDFRLLADDPAIRTINADLRPGSRPGEAALLLLIDPQDRVDLYLTGSNSRSPSVGGERIAAGGSIRNLLASGDLISAEAGMTEGLDDYTASYSTPLFTPTVSLMLRGSINNAAVVDSQLVPLDIRSRDRAGEVGLNYAVVRRPLTPLPEAGGWSPAQALSLGVSVAKRRSRSFLLGQPFSFSPGSVDGRTRYTALRLTSDYLVRNVQDVFAVSITGSLGLDGTRSPAPGAFESRPQFQGAAGPAQLCPAAHRAAAGTARAPDRPDLRQHSLLGRAAVERGRAHRARLSRKPVADRQRRDRLDRAVAAVQHLLAEPAPERVRLGLVRDCRVCRWRGAAQPWCRAAEPTLDLQRRRLAQLATVRCDRGADHLCGGVAQGAGPRQPRHSGPWAALQHIDLSIAPVRLTGRHLPF